MQADRCAMSRDTKVFSRCGGRGRTCTQRYFHARDIIGLFESATCVLIVRFVQHTSTTLDLAHRIIAARDNRRTPVLSLAKIATC